MIFWSISICCSDLNPSSPQAVISDAADVIEGQIVVAPQPLQLRLPSARVTEVNDWPPMAMPALESADSLNVAPGCK